MSSIKPTILSAFIALSAGTTAVQAKEQELPPITEDGLHLVPDTEMAIVYADPEADLEPYNRVMLMEAYVAFKKNWARDQRSRSASSFGPRSKDMERIKSTLATEFQEVFATVLEDGGYPVVDEAGEDVLLVRPAIINLDPTAPETSEPGRRTTYVSSAGEMTLYIELYDSVTGDIIAKAMDRRADRRHDGFYTWASSATNKAAAERILKGWAMLLLEALNEAKQ
jgi:hypothetical protein